ncbi:unnamed protein product [Vicia faba]|uniref:Uncharacterized protein n=1 Tax=Vicia faba TaxID=3906 RepID=A0AAV1AHC5_VICFA|nr:unnamed protein product [Vicia faba]
MHSLFNLPIHFQQTHFHQPPSYNTSPSPSNTTHHLRIFNLPPNLHPNQQPSSSPLLTHLHRDLILSLRFNPLPLFIFNTNHNTLQSSFLPSKQLHSISFPTHMNVLIKPPTPQSQSHDTTLWICIALP